MREQSHKDEMATALRGDFARLRARGVASTLAPDDAPALEIVAEPPTAPETMPEPLEPARDPALAAPATARSPVVEQAAQTPAAPARGGWFARLRGR